LKEEALDSNRWWPGCDRNYGPFVKETTWWWWWWWWLQLPSQVRSQLSVMQRHQLPVIKFAI